MAFVVYGCYYSSRESREWLQIGLLFCGLQPIVSTCMTMTKTDVRKYTQDVVTLSYIRTSLSTAVANGETQTETT